MPGYNPASIEKKWQQFWAEKRTYATAVTDAAKPKYYVLDMFPYPSGQGLHVGHPLGYIATDIIARYKRATGFNVMHPMGWDAFGLPAEQYAIKNNVHPRETTANNINRFRLQLQSLGLSYDWDREVDTTDPHYYRWTQWIFLKLYDTWFDEQQQKGRPISELIEEFKSGKRALPEAGAPDGNPVVDAQSWNSLSSAQQRHLLAHYRLAYEAEVPVNWCPALGTVLSNEEVIDGKSEVGDFPVERRPMRQWMLRITAYANRLIHGLDPLEWSDSLKEMQRNWIGKSVGAEVTFEISNLQSQITVFTTRPDTLFGATYMVMAPEHSLVASITTAQQKEKVAAYQKWAGSRSDRERQEDTKKTGEFTGSYAINPVNQHKIPIYISDYVLMNYGTGAIMAVPAHDQRDHEFATKFQLPIVRVVGPTPEAGSRTPELDVQKEAFVEEGVAVNSPWIDGLRTQAAKSKMLALLEEKQIGKRQINYKLRDWLFSRQRYWGEPFPIVHLEDGTTAPLVESELPLMLPELADFKPTGTIEPPLSKAKAWVHVHVAIDASGRAAVVPPGTPGALNARRELNTMPQWAGSCWYYLRYLDPRNEHAFVTPSIEKYWLSTGVDMYVGGVEHAVLHLLYSRFWHKVLFDRGLVSHDEPFRRLVNQGLMLGEPEYTAFRTDVGGQRVSIEFVERPEDPASVLKKDILLPAGLTPGQCVTAEKLRPEQVEKRGEHVILREDPAVRVDARSFKMSKSRGNVVNPDDIIHEYGADSLRMFEMFMGPIEAGKPWSTAGVEGLYRFLQRVWRNLFDENDQPKIVPGAGDETLLPPFHRLIKKVTDDIERLGFNTAIAAMMEFNNTLAKSGSLRHEMAVKFMRLLEPFAPHFAEEAYQRLAGGSGANPSITTLPWPTHDPAMLIDATLELPVQINGKLRSRVTVPNDADEATVLAAALADPEVQRQLAGKPLKKKIYVKGRMVNLVL